MTPTLSLVVAVLTPNPRTDLKIPFGNRFAALGTENGRLIVRFISHDLRPQDRKRLTESLDPRVRPRFALGARPNNLKKLSPLKKFSPLVEEFDCTIIGIDAGNYSESKIPPFGNTILYNMCPNVTGSRLSPIDSNRASG